MTLSGGPSKVMFPTPNRRYITIAGVILFLEWTWLLLGSPRHEDILASLPSLQKVSEDIFDYPFVESNALKDICDSTEWNSELIFTCEDNSGSVADVKNSILNCLRFTIAAGGRLVNPRIVIPNNETSPADSPAKGADFGYMFDIHHFLMSLHLSCPQLNTYRHVDDIPPRAWMHDPLSLRPEDLQSPVPPTGIPSPETWGKEFRSWLNSQTANRAPTRGLMVVNLARSPPVYPVASDEGSLAYEFSSFLKVQPDARKLATSTFHAIINKYNIDAKDSYAIAYNAYIGAYLGSKGAADDASNLDGTPSRRILNEALAGDLRVIYLASSNSSSRESLAAVASPLGVRIATKFDLLRSRDAKALQALAPEQQGLIDYLVLGKASEFMGVGGDAFGWSVALGRQGKWRRDGGEGMEGELMRDSLSRIYGDGGDDEFASCLWP